MPRSLNSAKMKSAIVPGSHAGMTTARVASADARSRYPARIADPFNGSWTVDRRSFCG